MGEKESKKKCFLKVRRKKSTEEYPMLSEFEVVRFCLFAGIPVPGYRSWKSHLARTLFSDVMNALCSVVDDFLDKGECIFDHPDGKVVSIIEDSGRACSLHLRRLLIEEDLNEISRLVDCCKKEILLARDRHTRCPDHV